jgi:hypothetical protein
MKKIFIIVLLNSLFVHILNSQTLIQQIENAYNALDTVSYIEKLRLSFEEIEKNHLQRDKIFITEELGLDYDSTDSIRENFFMEERIKDFNTKTNSKTPQFVLNLVFKTAVERSLSTLIVDTTELSFNLFYFGKNYKGNFYIYCEDGKYNWKCNCYAVIFSKELAINVLKSFKKIMKKNPKYLLYCGELEYLTIMYVLNDKIFIYRVTEMKEYELDEFFRMYFK